LLTPKDEQPRPEVYTLYIIRNPQTPKRDWAFKSQMETKGGTV